MDQPDDNLAAPAPGAPADRPARSPYERFADRDVADLIRDYPLAWLCPAGGDARLPSVLPLMAETDADGRLTTLVGHMARRNPLVAALTADPAVLILFTGPQAYISPAYVSDRTWAPTWNYAQLRIAARIRFEPDGGDAALSLLTAAMDHDPVSGWTPADMGARYRRMEQAIIAFRADVTRVEGKFKLGQDERPETLREILGRHPDAALVRWMCRFNPGRV